MKKGAVIVVAAVAASAVYGGWRWFAGGVSPSSRPPDSAPEYAVPQGSVPAIPLVPPGSGNAIPASGASVVLPSAPSGENPASSTASSVPGASVAVPLPPGGAVGRPDSPARLLSSKETRERAEARKRAWYASQGRLEEYEKAVGARKEARAKRKAEREKRKEEATKRRAALEARCAVTPPPAPGN